jgi:exonuclease-1
MRQLTDHGIKPVVVFDGAPLPAKAATEAERAHRRQVSLARAFDAHDSGNKAKAFQTFVQAVEITTFLARKFQEALEVAKIDFVVAPYEADAQLAFLSLNKSIDFVISEDSDLLTYGCQRVLYKLDAKTGRGIEISLSDVFNKFPILTGDNFQLFCILCGCDYLPALPKMNPKKSYTFIQRCLNHVTVPNLIRMTQMHSITVSFDFEAKFIQAFQTFKHQTVFDSSSKSLVSLNPISDSIDDSSHLGAFYESSVAEAVANGRICPVTKLPFQIPPRLSLDSLRSSVTSTADVVCIDNEDERENESSPPQKKPKLLLDSERQPDLDKFAFRGAHAVRESRIAALSSFSYNNFTKQ